MRETEKIWFNGELVDWGDARIHVGSHGLHYGTGVFEGIRCYATERGLCLPSGSALTEDDQARVVEILLASRTGTKSSQSV